MNVPINLMHLKFFCDAVLQSSISEAAKKNYVTQSTVSQGILKLESSLGVELIAHARQKFIVTEAGKIVFEHSRQVFKAIQSIHDSIEMQKEEISGTLKFVSTNSLGMSFLAPLYKEMQSMLPAVNFSFQLGNQNFIRNALRSGEADFAIVVYDHDFSQFNKRTIKKGRFQLYHHMDAPIYQIENGILVDNIEGMHIKELLNYFCGPSHSPLKIQSALAGWEVVARFTDMNIGVGFFPDYLMDHMRYPNLRVHPQTIPQLEYEICAIYNKGEAHSRATEAFLKHFANDDNK